MDKPLQKLDSWLNRLTMYRLVAYGLVWLCVVAAVLSLVGTISYPIQWLIKSGIALSISCAVSNYVLAWLYRVPSNQESSIITMLIMFLIIKPPDNIWDVIGVGIAGGVAMVSKYALTWRGAVVLNPAAFGVLVVSLSGLSSGAWWVANKYMLIPTLLVGLLVLRKTRRFQLFTFFAVPAMVLLLVNGVAISTLVYSFPIVFLGTIMLTEPATMPQTNRMRIAYGLLVGVLLGLRLDLGFVTFSPHLALLIGNVFALLVSHRAASVLTLTSKQQLTSSTWEYTFRPDRSVAHRAGQYAEFTIPGLWLDARGNRRTFTIASAPEDDDIRIGVKFYEPSSVFKSRLQDMREEDTLNAAHVAGDFTLSDPAKPLLFVAGGIGITPFVAMVRGLMTRQQQVDIVLVYFVANDQEVAYKDVLDQAVPFGVKTIVISGSKSSLTQPAVAAAIPDYASRHTYISGPPAMVHIYKASFKAWGTASIKTDYFSGY